MRSRRGTPYSGSLDSTRIDDVEDDGGDEKGGERGDLAYDRPPAADLPRFRYPDCFVDL